MTAVRLNILRHTVNINIVWKPPLLRCGRIVQLSYHTECGAAALFVWLWCCCLFVLRYKYCVAVTRKTAVFSLSILRRVPTYWRGDFVLTVTRKMTVIAREVLFYVTISGDMRGTAEQRSWVRFDGSSVVLLWWFVLYVVDMWSVRKESSWKLGNLFQAVPQS